MKNLYKYINEHKPIKNINEYLVGKISHFNKDAYKSSKYKFFPKTRKELVEIIDEHANNNLYLNGNICDLNDIDVSAITDFSNLFMLVSKHTKMNYNVSEWDVSNATNMSEMFYSLLEFECDLSKWDVSHVKNISGMFMRCLKFTGTGLENWDVSNVEDMTQTFRACNNLNCDLSKWDVSNVKYFTKMFLNCGIKVARFDPNISNWDVHNAKFMAAMFQGCDFLDCDLTKWTLNSDKVNIAQIFYNTNSSQTMLNNIKAWKSKVKHLPNILKVDWDSIDPEL